MIIFEYQDAFIGHIQTATSELNKTASVVNVC